MLENGYIRLHRKLINWEWYKNQNTKDLFIHLLMTVNYEDKNLEGITIKRGSRVASYSTLERELGISIQSLRTAVKHLKSTKDITSEQQGKFTVFTVVNYDTYQFNQQDNQQTTNKALTSDQQRTNNDVIKINKDNEAININKYIHAVLEKNKNPKLLEAYLEFAKHRNKMKRPMTAKAVDLLINKVNKLEPFNIDRQIAVINQAIECGWTTVWPLKEEVNNNAGDIRSDNSAKPKYGDYI